MIDLRSRFIEFYFNELQTHPIWKEMEQTVEDSPWHREANVAVHTNMVVGEYLTRAGDEWGPQEVVGALACAFHDFGKPDAEETVFSEARGEYRRYHGHEKTSARIFEDWAAQNIDKLNYLGLNEDHIFAISWLCEHHLPWAIKKTAKREALAYTVKEVIGLQTFVNALLSDTFGRISDDEEEKRFKALQWVGEFKAYVRSLPPRQIPDVDAPTLYVSIGSPGCGKSTFRKTLPRDVLIHNMDEMRVRWYIGKEADEATDAEYDQAYKASTEDKQFASKVHQEFVQMIKTGQDVYCDNTNGSTKRRTFYVTEARKKGYKIVAVLFPISLQECIDRQATRPDKSVPEHAVKRIYMGQQLPQLGEFDEIKTVTSNL